MAFETDLRSIIFLHRSEFWTEVRRRRKEYNQRNVQFPINCWQSLTPVIASVTQWSAPT